MSKTKMFKFPVKVYDAYILQENGVVDLERYNKFRKFITHNDNTPFDFDMDDTICVRIGVVNTESNFVDVLAIVDYELPSCLFAGCKDGDSVVFKLNGQHLILRLHQKSLKDIKLALEDAILMEDPLQVVKRPSLPDTFDVYGGAFWQDTFAHAPKEDAFEQALATLKDAIFIQPSKGKQQLIAGKVQLKSKSFKVAVPVYDVYVRGNSTGYIYEDNTYHFRSRITSINNNQLEFDGGETFYVAVKVEDNEGQFINVLQNIDSELPSCLFSECIEGDCIAFKLDGKQVMLRLNQAINGCRFESVLATLHESITCRVKYSLDNVMLPPNTCLRADVTYQDPRLVKHLRHPFFMRSNRLVLPGAVIAHCNEDERPLTPDDIKKIPRDDRRHRELPYLTGLPLGVSCPALDVTNCMYIAVPGTDRIRDIRYMRQRKFLMIWLIEYNYTEGRCVSGGRRNCFPPEVLIMDHPFRWTEAGLRFVSLPNGYVAVLPRNLDVKLTIEGSEQVKNVDCQAHEDSNEKQRAVGTWMQPR